MHFVPSERTMIGALARYISNEEVENFQPMGANFGALPPLDEKVKLADFVIINGSTEEFLEEQFNNIFNILTR